MSSGVSPAVALAPRLCDASPRGSVPQAPSGLAGP